MNAQSQSRVMSKQNKQSNYSNKKMMSMKIKSTDLSEPITEESPTSVFNQNSKEAEEQFGKACERDTI